jgi:hypothetical protein
MEHFQKLSKSKELFCSHLSINLSLNHIKFWKLRPLFYSIKDFVLSYCCSVYGCKLKALTDFYRAPSFLAVLQFGSIHAYPLPPHHVSKLDRRLEGDLRKRDKLLTGEGEGGGRGAKSYDRKKAWPFINHSMLSWRMNYCYYIVLHL